MHACLLLSVEAAHATRFVSIFEDSPRCERARLFVFIFYFLAATDAEPLSRPRWLFVFLFLRNTSLGCLPVFQPSFCSVATGLPEFLIVLEN